MTKRQGKSETIDVKALGGGRGVSAGAGADGAAGGARSGDDRGLGRGEERTSGGPTGLSVGLLRPDVDHAVGKLELRVPQDRTGRFSTELFGWGLCSKAYAPPIWCI
jgi:hypothetical protein